MKAEHSPESHQKTGNLDRFRRRRFKWWTIPLLLILGLAIWYGTTLYLAYRHATAQNVTGGSVLLSNNNTNPDDTSSKTGQINILLIGIGGGTHPGAYLSDTVMVASVDTKAKTISLLSVPRDLYVDIPGHGKDKINVADTLGTGKDGGPVTLKKVVSQTLGIPIHYYIRVDFDGFRQIINDLGGVTLNVKTAINDPYFPADDTIGYKPFYISAGVHTMDGNTALSYARSRETTSDFDRARRQQEVLVAVKDKVLTAQTLANPVKVTDIITTLGDHILTDFTPAEIQKLVSIGRGFGNPKIQNAVLGQAENNLVTTATSPYGASIVVPTAGLNDFSQIQLFAHAYLASPQIEAEKPTVLIENAGTTRTTTANLAQQLKWAGFTADLSSIPDTTDTKTTLYDESNGKKPTSAGYLTDTYKLTGSSSTLTTPSPDPSASPTTYDFVIAVGKDYSPIALQNQILKQAEANAATSTPPPL